MAERSSTLTHVLLKLPHVHFNITNCPVTPRPGHWNCFDTGSVVWSERCWELAHGDVASLWTLWGQSLHWAWQFRGPFMGFKRFPVSEQNKSTQYIYIYIYIYMVKIIQLCHWYAIPTPNVWHQTLSSNTFKRLKSVASNVFSWDCQGRDIWCACDVV